MMNIKKDKLKTFNPKDIYLSGWIKSQLETQMQGLTGALHTFWPDIKDSAWIGGTQDSWERVPYWLDGYLPLAYLLKDKKAIKVAEFYLENILKRQQEDGWIAPGSKQEREKYDVWGIFIILKTLLAYAKIKKSKRIYLAIYRALKALDEHINQYPLFEWAKMRWYECLFPIYAVYNIYKEQWLIDLAHKLHDQGFDFVHYYEHEFLTKKETVGNWNLITHIVNNVMAVKGYALYSQLTKSNKDKKISDMMLKKLNKYHGAVTGAVNGDECLSGLDPIQGSELCSIVELMFSLETLNQITGSPKYLAQLERLAFNALPSALTNDMWAHQYDNQVNAPFIKRNDVYPWTSNGPEANIYGLEPHFGCCTSNYHQGWPKFVNSAICYDNKGLFINSYLPISIKDRKYEISITSGYPFDLKNIIINIKTLKPIKLRLYKPDWATSFVINNVPNMEKSGYITLELNKGDNLIKVEMDASVKLEKRYKGNVSIVEGPLVYALKIKDKQIQINMDNPLRQLPHGDFEFHNEEDFAFRIEEFKYETILNNPSLEVSPFVNKQSYKTLMVEVRPVKYKIVGNYALIYPHTVTGELTQRAFEPIGIHKLHMGEIYKAR